MNWKFWQIKNEDCNMYKDALYEKSLEVAYLKKQVPKIDPLETFWNNKRPKTESYSYKARPAPGFITNINVDPRIFFVNHDILPSVSGSTNDEKAKNALQFVIDKVTYTPDMTQFKDNEVWLFPFETMSLKKGDCEDGAILLANILLANGIPYWRVRLNAGDVNGGGHCFVTYLRESYNQWVILDWCYWPDKSVDLNELYKGATENYFKIWFSFNRDYIYLNEEFERSE